MSQNLYIGNLSYGVTDVDLVEFFTKVGSVETAKVILDRETNRSRGFGFVEMGDDANLNGIIDELDGQDFMGRPLVVRKARERNGRERPNSQGSYRQSGRGR